MLVCYVISTKFSTVQIVNLEQSRYTLRALDLNITILDAERTICWALVAQHVIAFQIVSIGALIASDIVGASFTIRHAIITSSTHKSFRWFA